MPLFQIAVRRCWSGSRAISAVGSKLWNMSSVRWWKRLEHWAHPSRFTGLGWSITTTTSIPRYL